MNGTGGPASNETKHFLIFGDLHGRVLPAFRLAQAWEKDHVIQLDALLQVGDLGYFPDLSRLDSATVRHAKRDPSELGVQDVMGPNRLADAVFAASDTPMLFTAGNHEDHEALESLMMRTRNTTFAVDFYQRVWCIRDGEIAELPDGPRVAAVWGIDNAAPLRRKSAAGSAGIRPQRIEPLALQQFDILLSHESPRDAVRVDSGSLEISLIIEMVKPKFAFFGHYHSDGLLAERDFGATRVFRMHGMELDGPGGTAESHSVGHLQWQGGDLTFEYLPDEWLRTFRRQNWKHR